MKPRKGQRNGTTRTVRMPKWKRRLEEYRAEDLVKITFSTEGDLDAGTALIWGGSLTGAPFNLDPNGPSFIIPRTAAPYFAKEGIKFTLHPAFPPRNR